jgi:hypothetical protein
MPILAVTAVDLYLAIPTFEFGEAELRGSCGVVSFSGCGRNFCIAGELPDFAGTVFERSYPRARPHAGTCPSVKTPSAPLSLSRSVECIELNTSELVNLAIPAVSQSQAARLALAATKFSVPVRQQAFYGALAYGPGRRASE